MIKHIEPMRLIVVESDASQFAISAVQTQDIDGQLHPSAFYSRQMDTGEINYDIHHQELLTIPSPVLGLQTGPLSCALCLVAYNNTATDLNPPLENYQLKDT
jgi:hypothetical protein